MRTNCLSLAIVFAATFGAFVPVARAADPVVVELVEQATVQKSLVAIGDVARVSGGDPIIRERIARLDIAELKAREQSLSVTRQLIEFRLQIADINLSEVQVIGAGRSLATISRRTVTSDEVVAASRAELLRRLASTEGVTVELVQPIAVKLPEIPAGESATITAQPRGRVVGLGRVQMDVTISAAGEKLLSLAVWLEVKSAARSGDAVARIGGIVSPSPMPHGSMYPSSVLPAGGIQAPAVGEVLVHSRQRVTMQVRAGELSVTAIGEAQQEGRLGDSILVQNVDSKKTVTARIIGPAVVEIELGGGP